MIGATIFLLLRHARASADAGHEQHAQFGAFDLVIETGQSALVSDALLSRHPRTSVIQELRLRGRHSV